MELQDLQAKIGEELGVSKWFVVDQTRIDAFANCVEDHQFIHGDPARHHGSARVSYALVAVGHGL